MTAGYRQGYAEGATMVLELIAKVLGDKVDVKPIIDGIAKIAEIHASAQRFEAERADIEWIVNDLGELGVKIGDVFAFLYKGRSYLGGSKWRPVYKREFGEVCHPPSEVHPDRGRMDFEGNYTFGNAEDWQPLPGKPETT